MLMLFMNDIILSQGYFEEVNQRVACKVHTFARIAIVVECFW